MTSPRRTPPKRRQNLRRLVVLGGVAALAFLVGLVVGAVHVPPERRLGDEWASAWKRGDYTAMYALLSTDSQKRISLRRFTAAFRAAATTATLADLTTGKPRVRGSTVAVPTQANTHIFGTVIGDIDLPIVDDDTTGERRVTWNRDLVFPGLRPGEKLSRQTTMPPRATIEARDGTPLAQGDARLSDLGPVAAEVAGRVGPAPAARAAELAARGVPDGAAVGLTGLELQFDSQLAGTPGGVLRAGTRLLAASSPHRGHAVRTTIDPDLQRAAVTALAGRYGGIAVVRPSTGAVLAMAGIASSAPQPPGSVFKIITLTAALTAHAARPASVYPAETAATLEGVALQNANGESCGGTLIDAFAKSCNSVFAPLGVRVGPKTLVSTAERFGFNEDPGVAGAARATIPGATEIGDDLAVGSTAIGQGKVLATPLTMVLAASAIAEHGRRPRASFLRGNERPPVQATTPHIARVVTRAMRAVVTEGTGVGAAIPGVEVAGKTGTAELRSTVSTDPTPVNPDNVVPPQKPDTSDTDAWFAAFAPAKHPRVAVCVLLVAQGAGGDTAAPAAKVVLDAALHR
jgi:penicillin-binding protein A